MINVFISIVWKSSQRLLTTLRLVVSSMVWMTLSLCLKRICSITSARIEPNFWHKKRKNKDQEPNFKSETEKISYFKAATFEPPRE